MLGWPKPEEQSATAIRMSQAARDMAYEELSRDPDRQAEAIARHYLSLAHVALQLKKLTMMKRNGNGSYSYLIHLLTNEIKNHHAHDFGLELEWPKKQP